MPISEQDKLRFLDRMALSRRGFLGGAAALGAAAAMPSGTREAAAAEKLRFCSWGGSIQKLQRQHVIDPFTKATGIEVLDESLPLASRIKAMVDNGNLEFDVVQTDLLTLLSLEEMGDYFEVIDYSKLSAAALAGIPDSAKLEKGVGYYYWSYNIGYRTDKFPNGAPQNWADVWDAEKFPGKRTLASADGGQYPSLEFALMADGVDKADIYPIDMDRAFTKLDEIKPHVAKWWSSGSEVAQLYTSGEVTTGSIYSSRVLGAQKEGAPVALNWNQGQASLDYILIIKGAPLDAAHKLIDALLQVEPTIEIFNEYDGGPANQDVLKGLVAGRAEKLPSYPANLEQMYVQDSAWWAENLEGVIERFQEWTLL